MNVAFLFRPPQKGGKSIEEIFQLLAKKLNYDCEVSFFFWNNQKSFFANLTALRRCRADLYHITGDIHYTALFLLGKKVLITIHDAGHYKNLKGIKKFVFGLFWFRLPMATARQITTVSEFTKNDLIRLFGISPTKITVIPNPTPEIFKPCLKEFNTQSPTILQVGTSLNKNLDRLVEAISGLPCKLSIIGPLSPTIHSKLKRNQIVYENFTDLKYEEVYQKYVECDLVAFVSTHEGFGMPVLEANAVGRPVVSSNICSIPEVAGQSAVLVDPFKVDSIRAGLEKVIYDPSLRKELIRKGLENAKRFDVDIITQQYASSYKELLAF